MTGTSLSVRALKEDNIIMFDASLDFLKTPGKSPPRRFGAFQQAYRSDFPIGRVSRASN
jgi:hypothetical protein